MTTFLLINVFKIETQWLREWRESELSAKGQITTSNYFKLQLRRNVQAVPAWLFDFGAILRKESFRSRFVKWWERLVENNRKERRELIRRRWRWDILICHLKEESIILLRWIEQNSNVIPFNQTKCLIFSEFICMLGDDNKENMEKICTNTIVSCFCG